MTHAFDPVVQFLFSVLLNSLWEGIAIAILAAIVLYLTPRINATTRASVLTAALIAAILVPIGTAFLTRTSATTDAREIPAQRAATTYTVHAHQPLQRLSAPQREASQNASPAAPQAVQNRGAFSRLQLALPRTAILAIVAVWLLAVLFALGRLAISLLHLERLKHDALPLDIEYRTHMERWMRAAKGRRGVRLCRSPEIVVPIAVGLFDAMILVPETLLEELGADDVDRILLHELAHLRRGDDWINALERIAQSLFFFNPGILWIIGRLDLEREVVCDDWVLNQTSEIRQYATCLARVAEITAWPYRAMTAPGAFITRRSMSIRVERLLQAGRDIRTRTSLGPAGFALSAFVALCILAAFVSPSVAYTPDATRTHGEERSAQRERIPNHSVAHAAPRTIALATATPAITVTAAAPAIKAPPTFAPATLPPTAPRSKPSQSITHFTIHVAPRAAGTLYGKIAIDQSAAAIAAQSQARTQIVAQASSSAYIDELAAAGYRNLSLDDLFKLKSLGVDAQYIRGLENAGIPHPSVDTLEHLAALGVTPNYVRQMRRFLPNVSPDDLAGLKAVGVTADYIDALHDAGYSGLSANEVQSMAAVGVDTAYVRQMRAAYPGISAHDLQSLRAVGVTPEYLQAMRAAGYGNLSAQDAERMKALGIDGAFIRDAAAHGFHNLSIDQLVRLKTSGIL